MEKSLKRKIVLWSLMLLVAFWIVMLPAWCKAEPRPWTGDEKIMLGWSIAAMVGDMGTTIGFLGNTDNWEVNPVLGRRPEPLAVITTLLFTQIITTTIAHFVPEITLPLFGKVNFRLQLLYTKASINTSNTCWNTRLDWR